MVVVFLLSDGVELRGLFLSVTVLGPGADGFLGLIFSIFHKNLSLTYQNEFCIHIYKKNNKFT